MSFRVVNEILDESRSTLTDRLVLIAIGETAHHDGVAWLPQGPEDDRKSIAFRARASVRAVERSVGDLVWNVELEVRKAQKGRRRLNVYRVVVGGLAYVEVDYERLPFEIDRPFSPSEDLISLRATRQLVGWSTRQRPANLSGREEGDDPTETGPTTRQSVVDDPPNRAAHRRARENGAPLDPSGEPSLTVSSSDFEEETVAAEAAGNRQQQNRDLVRAFAEVIGVWPDGHDEWSTWCGAFAPLREKGVTPDELALRARAYIARWPNSDRGPFGLTKAWQLLSASLERSYFELYRWATDNSWRINDLDESLWVVEQSTRVTDAERAELRATVTKAYRAHADPVSAFLQWDARRGFALDDQEWAAQLRGRTGAFGTRGPEARRQALDRRVALRRALADLDFGTAASA